MAKKLRDYVTEIADAYRTASNTTETVTGTELPSKIATLVTPVPEPTIQTIDPSIMDHCEIGLTEDLSTLFIWLAVSSILPESSLEHVSHAFNAAEFAIKGGDEYKYAQDFSDIEFVNDVNNLGLPFTSWIDEPILVDWIHSIAAAGTKINYVSPVEGFLAAFIHLDQSIHQDSIVPGTEEDGSSATLAIPEGLFKIKVGETIYQTPALNVSAHPIRPQQN